MNQENQMNIVVKEFNKFNKKTLLLKTRMREHVKKQQRMLSNCSQIGGVHPVHPGKVLLPSG